MAPKKHSSKTSKNNPARKISLKPKEFINGMFRLGILIFVVAFIYSWVLQITQNITCKTKIMGISNETSSSYIAFEMQKQEPEEPLFDAKIYIVSATTFDKSLNTVNVLRSAAGNYAPSRNSYSMFKNRYGKTESADWPDIGLPPQYGAHYFFPFDTSTFNFSISLTPNLLIKDIRVSNRVPGFILRCADLKAKLLDDGSINIEFKLIRNPLIQLTATLLTVAATIFVFFITQLEKIEALSTAVASYFFSIWSIRQILSSEIHTFPTVLDGILLSLCMLLLILIGSKFIKRINT